MAATRAEHRGVFRAIAVGLAVIAGVLVPQRGYPVSVGYFQTQDGFVIALLVAALVAAYFRLPAFGFAKSGRSLPAPSMPMVLSVAVVLALVLWAGTYALMHDYPLTRDEHMVVFDAAIYASGRLAEPLAMPWRAFATALVPAFLLEVPDNALLVSNYMPGNAAMRAAFSAIADPALMNPLLTGIGLVALHDIARRMFADVPAAIWVVLAGYVLSAQVLVTAMTTYAMTAHLALGLVWLALFLRGRWWQHVLAMALGAWALGLHQVIFHPLFAGPFILTLLQQRKWRTFAAYALVYGSALLFWTTYPGLVLEQSGIAAAQGQGETGGPVGFVTDRVIPLFTDRGEGGLALMLLNLMRLIAWTPLFILPLVAMAWPDIRHDRGIALPLAAGVVLTVVAMFALLPYQGHGWGYRYLHTQLGSLALLAGYGYARWAGRDADAASNGTVILGAITALVVLPFLLWSASSYVRPAAVMHDRIAATDADFVIIDTDTTKAAIDQVRNRPDLSNRPILVASHELDDAMLAQLCSRGTVATVGAREFVAGGFHPEITGQTGERFAALNDALQRGECSQHRDASAQPTETVGVRAGKRATARPSATGRF